MGSFYEDKKEATTRIKKMMDTGSTKEEILSMCFHNYGFGELAVKNIMVSVATIKRSGRYECHRCGNILNYIYYDNMKVIPKCKACGGVECTLVSTAVFE